uniref:acyl-CoA dehydrogenase n=1 Tax=Haloprofundus sp. MHR1 TaxID=2572921 RepID=UPI001F173ACD|nr:acyl-CoA dehydrogenase [Haloprofundus sp. MHR1]
MTNFKSGSGNLDFGSSDEDDKAEETTKTTKEKAEREEEAEPSLTEQTTSTSVNESESSVENSSDQSAPTRVPVEESSESGTAADQYPYFIRRNNVGDERDTRLEIHVRDKVANREAAFRNELAEELGANEVSKTDAREFALLAAFQYPERVAELMREEGFGALD